MKLWDALAAALTTGGLPENVLGAGTTLRVSSSAVSTAYSYTWILCPAPGSYDSRSVGLRKRKVEISEAHLCSKFCISAVCVRRMDIPTDNKSEGWPTDTELHQEQKQVKLNPHLPPGEAPPPRTPPSGGTIS
ncbi:unnamed protein product [Rangifer tarandus platyrhynchus]|uniref:Uncharacterized protein n=1 Tax=Rangifer tarandus platyrhynchus TaxID=3082113 RepID=A0AC59ZMN6_RANTA